MCDKTLERAIRFLGSRDPVAIQSGCPIAAGSKKGVSRSRRGMDSARAGRYSVRSLRFLSCSVPSIDS
eukprot:6990438-Alexandrium_andersonii.AAC.1